MSSNSSFRNINIHKIIQQNDQLRHAISQSLKNQSIIQELASKLEYYKSNEIELVNLNAVLSETVNAQKKAIQQREIAFNEEMHYVFCGHDKILSAKDQENRQLQQYARAYQEREIQLSQNYELELTRYKIKIGEFETELEAVYRASEKQKAIFEKTKSNWAIEQQAQNAEITKISEVIKKLESDNLMLIDYSKEIQASLIKVEQQNKATLITLRDKLISQQSQIHNLIYLNRNLENSNQILANQLEQLKRLQAHLANDNQGLTENNNKLANLLTESDQQSKFLRDKITQLELTLNKNLTKNEVELKQLRNEKLQLLRSKTEAQGYANAKVTQLRQLTASINKFQTLSRKQEGHIKSLTSDLDDLELFLNKQKQKNQENDIRMKELTDQINTLKIQNGNYQSINNKLQIQIEQLQAEAMSLAKTSISSKDINKEFIDQMNTMLVKFRQERQQQSRLHILQRQKLKQRYEFQLKQKQLDLLKRISFLEEQVSLSQQFQILTERNSNIYTFTSSKYEY